MRAEFFGVLGAGPLSDAARQAFERMRRAHTGPHPAGDVAFTEHERALVGVCTRRADGRTVVRSENGLTLALAGDPDRAWDSCDLEQLKQELLRGERPGLTHRQPPAAFCLIDDAGAQACAWLVGDRYGLVPVHVARHDGLVLFSSRLAPLLGCGLVDARLDRDAVLDFFTFGHVTGDKTLHACASVLPAAGRMMLTPEHVRTDVYVPDAHTQRCTEPPPNLEQAARAIEQSLRASVEEAVRRTDVVAVTLSGGMDSRALLGFAKEAGADVRTYTFGQPGSRDALIAEAVARVAEVPHSFVPLDGSFLPRWLDHAAQVSGGAVGAQHIQILSLLDRVRAEAGAVLDGLSGDMLAGGHVTWRLAATRSPERAVELIHGMHAADVSTASARAAFFEDGFLEVEVGVGVDAQDPRAAIRAHVEPDAPAWWTGYRFDRQERQRRFIQYGPHLYRHAVDVHTPFYADGLPELLAGLPMAHLIEQRAYVQMHRRSLPRLASIRDSARGLPLSWPQEIRFAKRVVDAGWRRAARLGRVPTGGAPASTDYATWFRTTCRGLLEERLLDGGDVLEGVVRRSAVERTLGEHLSGQRDHTQRLGNLLSLTAWLEGLRGHASPRVSAGSTRNRTSGMSSRTGQPVTPVGIVAIGRNEGERLARCVASLDDRLPSVYVDSGSTDGSVALATANGLDVVELDDSRAFSAARARNEGLERLLALHEDVRYVQFLDSDCELDAGWVDAARRFLDAHSDVAVVCGRRRELHPEHSVYNRLADMEWNTPLGDAFTCGGDSMMRVDAFREAGGFDDALIAGEEPDLCLRIRRGGHRVVRLDEEMTLHDVDITRFTQWWRRSARWGHGYTEMVLQHGRLAERRWVRSLVSCLAWSIGLPALALLLAPVTSGASLFALLGYFVPMVRVFLSRRAGSPLGDALAYAVACVVGKFAEVQGALSCMWNRLIKKRRSALIEYKDV